MENDRFPQTLLEAVRYFTDLDTCEAFLASLRWPDGPACPKCGSLKVGRIASRRTWQCKSKGCRKQFSAKLGTIFEDSPIGLDKWLVGVWCIANSKNGISSCELSRTIGITQKSAWHMLHRIRLAMQCRSFRKITGEVEADETYVGGKLSNNKRKSKVWPKGRGVVGKTIVHGLIERGGEVRAKVVPAARKAVLQAEVRKNVEPGTLVCTDKLASYEGLDADFLHEMIDHTREYVRGRVHTNSMENFWSLLKRSINGTYVAVSPVHLHRYLDEQTRRFNQRHGTDAERFSELARTITGRRLTYAELTGKNGEV